MASSANAADQAAGRMATDRDFPIAAVETTTVPDGNSVFSMMSTMALQNALEGSATKSNGQDSIGDFVTFTPRVWITHTNLTESEGFDAGAVLVPMYGGSITLTTPRTPNFSLLATAFYGTGEGDAFGSELATGEGDSDVERTDIEILLRYHIPDTQLIVFGGPRYIIFDREFEFDSFDVDHTSEIWAIEAGVGTFGNLTDSGRHRFFGNFTLGVAFEAYESKTNNDNIFDGKEDSTGVSIDVNLGYEYLLADWVNLNLRYRTFVIFTEDDFEQSDLTTIHGPELGVALRF